MQSALTGHFVLSSLHATDAAAALHRLLDMGIESFLIASSVIGVVAQRLVRRICAHCREPYEPTPRSSAFYEDWRRQAEGRVPRTAPAATSAPTPATSSAIGVYELLRITDRDQAADRRRAHRTTRSARLAVEQGMRTLRDEALRLVEDDVTTIAEVVRTIYIG